MGVQFGVFLLFQPVHAVKDTGAADGQGPDAEVRLADLMVDQGGSHTDGKLVDPDPVPPGQGKMAELMGNNNYTENDQKYYNTDNHTLPISSTAR